MWNQNAVKYKINTLSTKRKQKERVWRIDNYELQKWITLSVVQLVGPRSVSAKWMYTPKIVFDKKKKKKIYVKDIGFFHAF